MLGSLLKILCIFGWCLLFLLVFLVVVLLLVVFYPVAYRVEGRKDEKNLFLKACATWLFGLVRVRYEYPSPGKVIVRVCFFTVFDSGKTSGKRADKKKECETAAGDMHPCPTDTPQSDAGSQTDDKLHSDPLSVQSSNQQDAGEEDSAISERLRTLWEKIIYTIRQICDKIRKIYESLDYYLALIQEEDTKLLFTHVMIRLRQIFKSICPRKISGEIHFGTGSPDTTGYGMALYGIVSPYLGKNLTVTPDFEEKVLEGKLQMKGHVILAVLVYHGLRVILDRRLRHFIKMMKREVK